MTNEIGDLANNCKLGILDRLAGNEPPELLPRRRIERNIHRLALTLNAPDADIEDVVLDRERDQGRIANLKVANHFTRLNVDRVQLAATGADVGNPGLYDGGIGVPVCQSSPAIFRISRWCRTRHRASSTGITPSE